MNRSHNNDLDPARGIFNGAVIGAVIWLVILIFAIPTCFGQTIIPQPSHTYYGVVLSDDFQRGSFAVPPSMQLELQRSEWTADVAAHGMFMRDNSITYCNTQDPSSLCYGGIHLMYGYDGSGLVNGDYVRVENYGTGPSIARKTAVRGDPNQWAVWAHQINLGPGAKAAFWIGSDNAVSQGRGVDTVPNVMVINSDLAVTSAVIQRNAPAGSTAAVLRVFNGNQIVAELLENGTLRVKRIEMLP